MLLDYLLLTLDHKNGSDVGPKEPASAGRKNGRTESGDQQRHLQQQGFAQIIPHSSTAGQVPSSSAELDDLLDKMLEIQSSTHIASYNQDPSRSGQMGVATTSRRDSANLIESVIAEDRTWTESEPIGHSGLVLPPGYYLGPQLGIYPTSPDSNIPTYYHSASQAGDYSREGYYSQPPIYGSHRFAAQHVKGRQRHPFERAVSNPEFYTPMHFFGDVNKKLATGQSQSMPAFEASASSDFEQPTSDVTPSPETSSPSAISPMYDEKTNAFLFGPSYSSAPGPSGLLVHKLRKPSPPAAATQSCAVCGDVAQCLHYGVRSCEGCKGFFKRSVQKNSKYVCLGSKDCVIDKRRRNRCQFCRFQKCLAVGMVKEVVRTDSLKGRRGRLPSKSKGSDESSTSGQQSLINALVTAFTYGSEFEHRLTIGGVSTMSSADRLPESVCASILATNRWADRLPDWTKLTPDDRNNLLLVSTGMIVSFRVAYLSINVADERKLTFDDCATYKVDSCDNTWLPWLNAILELSSLIKTTLNDDLTGFCCLKALLLFKNENVVLQNVEARDKMKNNFINCLKEHCTFSEEAKSKSPLYFSTVLALQNEIHSAARKAKEALLTGKWKQSHLPSIITETFSRV